MVPLMRVSGPLEDSTQLGHRRAAHTHPLSRERAAAMGDAEAPPEASAAKPEPKIFRVAKGKAQAVPEGGADGKGGEFFKGGDGKGKGAPIIYCGQFMNTGKCDFQDKHGYCPRAHMTKEQVEMEKKKKAEGKS